MNSVRETAAEAESICSTPLCSHQIISQHQTESGRGRKKQREGEGELVASSGLCRLIRIRLMSPAPDLQPLMLTGRRLCQGLASGCHGTVRQPQCAMTQYKMHVVYRLERAGCSRQRNRTRKVQGVDGTTKQRGNTFQPQLVEC